MGKEHKGENAQGVKKQTNQGESKDTSIPNQNSGTSWKTHSPPDQQPSASQNNEWQQNHSESPIPDSGQQGYAADNDDRHEHGSKGNPMGKFNEETEIGPKDQDYRDGINKSSEDQDNPEELREGK